MTIETELSDFVGLYSPFNREENRYTEVLEHPKLLVLGDRLRRWIRQQLLIDDATKKNVEKNYKKLAKLFHPDSSSASLPAVIWLEHQLSEGKNDGTCFKILSSCYEKLMEPAKFKEIEFSGINTKDDCRRWLEKLKAQSNTFSHRALCDSLIGLLDESGSFFDSSGTVKPKALKTLIQFIPAIIAGYGTIILMEELMAIYALYFVILKGGQKLDQSNYLELREVGRSMQIYSGATALLTTTLLVRIVEMIFWSSRQCLNVTLQISSALFTPLLSAPAEKEREDIDVDELCKDLVLAGSNKQPGMKFDHPELKVIAAPFEKYLGLSEQQFFRSLRIGDEKRKFVDAFLFKLRVLDKLPGPLEEKYKEVLVELGTLKNNKVLYTSKTAEAVNYIEQVITVLQSPLVNTATTEEESSSVDLFPSG